MPSEFGRPTQKEYREGAPVLVQQEESYQFHGVHEGLHVNIRWDVEKEPRTVDLVILTVSGESVSFTPEGLVAAHKALGVAREIIGV